MICVRDVIKDQPQISLQLEGDRGRMMKRHKGQRAIAGLSDANYE